MAFFTNLFRRKKKEEKNRMYDREDVAPVISRRMSYDVANLQGIGKRERQEDSFAIVNAMDVREIIQNGLLAIVADGMGGMQNGKQASELAVSCIREEFADMNREEDLCIQLKECLERAGEKVYERFHRKSGTTAIACVFYDEKLYFASVGDSSLYLKRGNQLLQLNREQTYREHLLRKMVHHSRWDIDEAWNDPEAECLMEFLGKDDISEPDYLSHPLLLEAGDRILLCSDGVSKVLSRQQILSCLEQKTSKEACQKLEEMILAVGRRTQDNYTAVLVACEY